MAKKLEALQALRAVAAGFVVLVHALYTYAEKVGPIEAIWPKYDVATFGVKLFFCISGYIIFLSAQSLPPGAPSCSLFARRRIIRIVPMYWVATFIYAAKLSLQGNSPSGIDIVRSLFFVPYADDSHQMRPVLGAGWTLNFEMMFYAILCGSLLTARKYRLAIVSIALAILMALSWTGLAVPNVEPGATSWAFLADPVVLFFCGGMLGGWVQSNSLAQRFLPATLRGGLLAAFLLLVAFVGPACVLGLHWLGDQRGLARVSVELLICSLLVLICASAGRDGSQGGRLSAALSIAGDGSYSTYLFHGFVMGPAARIVGALHLNYVSPWAFAAGMVVLCTAAGIAVFWLAESPLQRWMTAKWIDVGSKRKVSARLSESP